MRSRFINLLMLLALVVLSACGSSNSTKAVFSVSKGLAISNAGYTGGMTIYGKNLSTLETFAYSSMPNSARSNEIVLDLVKGNWSFSVVGWTGSAGTAMMGEPYCATVASVTLNSDNQTVELRPTKARCLGPEFAPSSMSTATNTIKPLVITACPVIAGGNTNSSLDFCLSQNLDESKGDSILAVKFQLSSKPLPGTADASAPILSNCIPMVEVGTFQTGLQLPSRNFPIKIILYKDLSCQNPTNLANFDSGLESAYTAFDKNLTYPIGAENPRLFIASTRSMKLTSPLEAVIPTLTCGAGNYCGFVRDTIAGGMDIILPRYLSYEEVVLSRNISCSQITDINTPATGNGSGLTISSEGCMDHGDSERAVIRVMAASGTCPRGGSDNCIINYKINGVPTSKTFKVIAHVDIINAIWQQDSIIQNLGISGNSTILINSLPHLDNTRKANGILHNVREMFTSHGIGGAYSDVAACSAASGIRYLDVFDEGELKRFQAEITTISERAPRQICDTTPSSDGLCADYLNKKITLRRPGPNGIFHAFYIIKTSCSKKIGFAEEHHQEKEESNNNVRIEKALTYWNTENQYKTKIEKYRIDQSINTVSNTIVKSDSDYTTVVKKGTSAADEVSLLNNMRYEYDSINSRESVRRNEIYTEYFSNNSLSYMQDFSNNNPGSGSFLAQNPFTNTLNSTSIHQKDISNQNDFIKIAKSPSGNYILHVEFSTTGNFKYKIISSAGIKSGMSSFSMNYSQGEVSINDNGKGVIGSFYSSGLNLLPIDYSLANPVTTPSFSTNLTGTAPVAKIDIYVGNDNLVTASVLSGSIMRSRIMTLNGADPVGNFTGANPYYSTSMQNNFSVKHINNTTAYLCYIPAAQTSVNCKTLHYPDRALSAVSGLGETIIISQASGVGNASFTINSTVLGDVYQFFNDSTCTNVVSTNEASTNTSTNVTTTSAAPGYNYYFYKKNSGTCSATNLSFYKSSGAAPYEGFESSATMPAVAGLTPFLDASMVSAIMRINDTMGMTFDYNGSTISSTSNPSMFYMVGNSSALKTNRIDFPWINATDWRDFDPSDVPVKFPVFDGTPQKLDPTNFGTVFTNSAVLMGQ